MSIRNDFVTSGGTLNIAEGTVSGNGTVGGDLTNAGSTIAPGNSISANQIPEPSAMTLLAVGCTLALAICRRNR